MEFRLLHWRLTLMKDSCVTLEINYITGLGWNFCAGDQRSIDEEFSACHDENSFA